jgi:hypothetical protein
MRKIALGFCCFVATQFAVLSVDAQQMVKVSLIMTYDAATLSPHGTLVSFAAMSEGPMSINPLDVIFKPLTMRGFWLGHPETACVLGEVEDV